jgi:hypothetical protein
MEHIAAQIRASESHDSGRSNKQQCTRAGVVVGAVTIEFSSFHISLTTTNTVKRAPTQGHRRGTKHKNRSTKEKKRRGDAKQLLKCERRKENECTKFNAILLGPFGGEKPPNSNK